MTDTKDILYSFSNNDNISTINKIENALYSRANDYINSRKEVVAKSIFDDNLDDNQPE